MRKLIIIMILTPTLLQAEELSLNQAAMLKTMVSTANVQVAINQHEARKVEEFLGQVDEDQANHDGKLPNPVYKDFTCIRNCGNRTGYVDVVIR